MEKGIKNLIKSSKGSTTIIFLCALMIIILLSAIFTDVGYIALESYKLGKSLEKIAIEGAAALTSGKDESIIIINDLAKERKIFENIDINISDNMELSLYVEKRLDHIFLKYIGFKDRIISKKITAKLSNIVSYKGVKPLAVEKYGFQYGEEYLLSTLLSIDSKGQKKIIPVTFKKRDDFNTSLIYGYTKNVSVEDNIYQEEYKKTLDIDLIKQFLSNITRGDTVLEEMNKNESTDIDGKQVWILPVVETLKEKMEIVGFTAFLPYWGELKSESGEINIKGKFIKYTVKSSVSDGNNNFGLYGIKVIRNE